MFYKYSKILVLSLLFFVACEEQDFSKCESSIQEIWIADNCTETEVGIIYTAVDKLNGVVGKDSLIVRGIIPDNDTWLDIIRCVPLYSYQCDSRLGLADIDCNITICADKIRDRYSDYEDKITQTIMHELGHYAGYGSHISDEKSVMNMYLPNISVTEYSEYDKMVIFNSNSRLGFCNGE